MKDPRNINIEKDKKKPYSFRIEESILNKLHQIAKLEKTTTAEVLKSIINEYLEEVEVYNNYLETSDSFYLQMPYHKVTKAIITDNTEYDLTKIRSPNTIYEYVADRYDFDTYYNEIELAKINEYEVAKTPNNLDQYNSTIRSYGGLKDMHNGLEFLIIPAVADQYIDYNLYDTGDIIKQVSVADFTGCLYILYFKTNIVHVPSTIFKYKSKVYLISLLEALNLIKEADNEYLYNLLINIKQELEEAESIEEVEAIATKYNTGNVVALSEKPVEEVKPIKLTTYANKYIIKQHDTEILERLTAIEKDKKDLEKIIEVLKPILVAEKGSNDIKFLLDNLNK